MASLIEPEDDGRSRWSLFGRIVAIVLVLGFALFWIWAFSGLPDNTHPDRVDDRAFATAAEARCAVTVDELDELATARDAEDLSARADQVDAATDRLEEMVAALEGLPAPAGDDGRIVDEWLADWRVYLSDRRAYVVVLRSGDDPPFAVTEKAGDQITLPIDVFANVNDMLACTTPRDL